MNFESWMVNIAIALLGIAGTYSVLRNRVSRLEDDTNKHLEEDKMYHKDIDKKIDAQFKRVDEVLNRCTILEQNSIHNLKLTVAEEKFVSKDELKLTLEAMKIDFRHTAKTVDKIEGKLEELLSVLSKG
jgi:hypothetical protein